MSGLKQLRNRVKSIKSTQKITKAMQVVSAAKLRRVKDQAENFDNYSSVLANIMNDIKQNIHFMDLSPADLKFFKKDIGNMPQLLVVMTSERGLCGSFNSQIIRAVKRDIAECKAQNIKVKLLVIGKKGHDALKGEYSDLIEEYYNVTKDNLLPIALQIKAKVITLVQQEKVGTCYLYYNRFKNALTQVMTKTRLLPVEKEDVDGQKKAIKLNEQAFLDKDSNYEYEGSGLVDVLINLYIIGVIKYGFLQNKASEEAARMTAMDNATKNAKDLIDKLTLKLNRSRQAIITTELTEIISGAEAL